MIRFDEAVARIHESVQPLAPTSCPPHLLLGCRLAAPLVAPGPLPAFDDSAMDGYAISASRVIAATRDAPAQLTVPKDATPIATGDPIPEGADAVVPLELVQRLGDRVSVLLPVARGANIRRRGEDVMAGDVVVPAGARIDASVVLAASALGVDRLEIHPKLRAAVLPVGPHFAAGRRDATGPAIHAALHELGAFAVLLAPVAGSPSEVGARIGHAASRADLLVTVGAASVGDDDVVPRALEEAGARRVFQGVAIKPGKPIGLWLLGDAAILVLPGSPAAALAGFDGLGRMVFARLTGDRSTELDLVHARAVDAIVRRKGKTGLLRGRLEAGPGGLRFTPVAKQGPSQVSAVAGTNAVAVIPPETERIEAGASLRVLLVGSLLRSTHRPGVTSPRAAPLGGSRVAGELESTGSGPGAGQASPRALPIVAICGLSDSGKTWLVERMVEQLVSHGHRVATIKHDAHGFEADPPGKDTARHRAAGAFATALVGPGRTALVREEELGLASLAQELLEAGAELIVAEGFKSEPGVPKIEVAARGRERIYASPLLALVTDRPGDALADVPVFEPTPEGVAALCDLVVAAIASA